MTTTLLPHDTEAERQVLGALMLRPDLILQVSSTLREEDMYIEAHRLIYQAVVEKNREVGSRLDAIQIIQHLDDRALTEKAGGAPYIMQLAQLVMAPGSVLLHARRIKSLTLRRSLMKAANSILTEAAEPVEDENSLLRNIENRILHITNSGTEQRVFSIHEMREEIEQHIENLRQAGGRITGTRTLFREFDRLTSGIKAGELIVVAARPGLGKTTLALNIAANVALEQNKSVLIYSLEMSRIELMMRLICAETQFPHLDLKRGHLSNRARDILTGIDRLSKSPIYIDDSGDLDIWDCMARTRKLQVELQRENRSLDLVIVDYLQLVSDPQARKLGRQHEVAIISRSLKQLARTVKTPVIALSQMNRSVEQRRGEWARPQLSDLRESGAIEQDADIVMFIHREMAESREETEEIDTTDLDRHGTVEMIIAKHRNGPVGSFRLSFRPEINRFDNRIEMSVN